MQDRNRFISTVIPADVVVVGAGFAGISTTYHLARQARGRKIVLVEKESLPGLHSSGRNAGMVRQVTSEENISALARSGADFIREPAAFTGRPAPQGLFRPTGSLLLACGEKTKQLEADIANAVSAGLRIERLTAGEARRRFPVLNDASIEIGCFSPTDGVVDLVKLVRYYVEAAEASGAHVLLSAAVEEVILKRGRIHGVRVGNVEVHAPVIVDAAGPWAAEVAAMAGATEMPLSPRRRHIFVTKPIGRSSPESGSAPPSSPDWYSSDWPFIWDISTEVYFRPEEGGLLFSPCDEGEPGEKDSDAVDPRAYVALRGKLRQRFPSLDGLPIARSWSGLRTLTADGRFVIGPDPKLSGFFWVAGLGGHGVTASYAIGELAAEILLHAEKDASNPHSPSRFLTGRDRKGKP